MVSRQFHEAQELTKFLSRRNSFEQTLISESQDKCTTIHGHVEILVQKQKMKVKEQKCNHVSYIP